MTQVVNGQATELDTLRAQVAALTAKLAVAEKPRALHLKVSEKGAVSLYGMGQWPTTLYAKQWERVFAHQDEIKAFIAANTALLSQGKAPKA